MELYVGNFCHTMTEKELKKLFSVHGIAVDVHIVTDYYTRQSKCFGYVEVDSADDAERAKLLLHGKKIDDRRLVVKSARSTMERHGSLW